MLGGLAKVSIRQEVAAGNFFKNSNEMVDFLKEIFVNKSELLYYFITIDSVLLDQERTSASLKEFTTVTGSS